MKTYFVSLGCPKNSVDMEAALTLLLRSGHEVTDDPAEADLLLVNACSFLESAWRETVEELERLARYKRRFGDKKLVLMGCLPTHMRIDLETALPEVDLFLAPGSHGSLTGLFPGPRSVGPASGAEPFTGFEDRLLLTPAHTAYVKIAEGCDHACDFCAIPRIKGPMISRSPASILREVEGMVAEGVREITVIGQDPASYRADSQRLPGLLESLARSGVDWIRVMYLHPASMRSDDLLGIFEIPQVCRYLDMPLQHASDRLLRRMKRGHTIAFAERLIERLRCACPDLVLRSEIITGYPGETEEEFEQLKRFITRARFATLGVFAYSPEPGTVAALRSDAVDPALRAERYAELVSVQEGIAFDIHSRLIGKTLTVLVDRSLDEDAADMDGCSFAGRYYGQAFEVDGEVFLRGVDSPVGTFITARITGATVYDLTGEAVEKA